ncbi:MAG: TspO protein [Candidatus Zambryskibacteria bacterium RIFOXYC1_FULL_39_10]|uniref:TspO protein n=1 Tax=Candidatus Zambryskibacteria bacterium RIFOXYC1_FULL_39_10 TaxID=1802779 RepID=A0A1G2UY00_9BACT|nr:MAG: TspO protein [Candidatus Zambryskibacteria bacterium RIFOXYC1_FULL_39_10]OHB14800.1 MAG: TspO protein [Candidatus Zambryskibacteria bacterium RIFOXYD1_FULL_39_35]
MSNSYNWYSQLIRPEWAPPAWIFGPVWTGLYILIAISFGSVFYKYYKKEVGVAVVMPFILNLVFNFAFTPIQFGLQNNLLAMVDILLVWLTLVWAIAAIWKHSRLIAYAQVPYLLWVSFATVLQITITFLNF